MYFKQKTFNDAREITAVWTYFFRENQVKQLFGFWREFGKDDNFIFVKISFCRISSRLFQ